MHSGRMYCINREIVSVGCSSMASKNAYTVPSICRRIPKDPSFQSPPGPHESVLPYPHHPRSGRSSSGFSSITGSMAMPLALTDSGDVGCSGTTLDPPRGGVTGLLLSEPLESVVATVDAALDASDDFLSLFDSGVEVAGTVLSTLAGGAGACCACCMGLIAPRPDASASRASSASASALTGIGGARMRSGEVATGRGVPCAS